MSIGKVIDTDFIGKTLEHDFNGNHTILTGFNGSGKSTLIRKLSGQQPVDKMQINYNGCNNNKPLILSSYLNTKDALNYKVIYSDTVINSFNDLFDPVKYLTKENTMEEIKYLSNHQLVTFLNLISIENTKDSVVFWDDIDIGLHPSVQKNLFKVMESISVGNQFIISTHSPAFVMNGLHGTML